MNLNDLAVACHETAKEKGFWDREPEDNEANQLIAKMMLITSEVSELCEAYVKQFHPELLESEFADVAIRLLDLYEAMKSLKLVSRSFDSVVSEKIEVNKSRASKHGKLM